MKPLPVTLVERLAAGALRLWLMAGLLLRVTGWRDAWPPCAVIFYATPWPAIALGMATLAAHALRRRHRHATIRYLVFTVATLLVWMALSWRTSPPPAGAPVLRIAEWNTGRPAVWRLEHQAAWLRAQDADLITLAEGVGDGQARWEDWATRFPEYRMEHFQAEMLCLVRGEVLEHQQGILYPGSYYGLLRVRVRGREYTILQADIYAKPTVSRREPLRKLLEIAQAHASERLLILGDFNTPRDSVLFRPFRTEFTHAFEAAGHGVGESWPMPFPLLTLDHLWCSSRLVPLDCYLGWPIWSDHRPMVAEFGEAERKR